MNKDEIKEVLRLHKMWLEGRDGGVRADLSYSNLRYTSLSGANLRYAYLVGADFSGADLSGANLYDADLCGTSLRYADLRDAYFSSVDLRYADLEGAHFSKTNPTEGKSTMPTDEIKEVTTNPKDLIGSKKPSVWAVPMSAVYVMGQAMLDGMRKYGLFNWREHEVRADIYIEAARRHLNLWAAMEETAEDSGVHHLGHAMACMAILLDAQQNDKLVDSRMPDPAYLKWMKEHTEC